MKRYAKIICDDARFSRMLTLELNSINIECVNDIADLQNGNKLYVIADLATASIDELKGYTYLATIIGFYNGYRAENDLWDEVCDTVLHRPFLIADFLALFDREDISPNKEHKAKSTVHAKKLPHLSVDPQSKSAIWEDTEISLSDNEYKVLSVLCENRGTIVERECIYSILGAEKGNMGDVYICHLRKKIDNRLGLKLIYTIHGKGYMLKN